MFSQAKFTILDGGMGTMLQAAGLGQGTLPELAAVTAPDVVEEIHRAYVQAGARVLCANTFGANGHKLAGTGHTVEEVVKASVSAAKRAAEGHGVKVALDVGPLGEMLEPNGTLSFEQAYEMYREVMLAGVAAGADLVMIETMADLYEAKAALLAAKENTALPVLVSMTFEQNGRTFTGTPVEAMALTLGSMGAAALGINCSLGPKEIVPLAQRLCKATPLPVFVKPNAGLPNPPSGVYSVGPKEFCRQLQPCLAMGVSMVGGCCGTTPETIGHLSKMFADAVPAARTYNGVSAVCSATQVQVIDGALAIGERINPTGKKRLKEALYAGDLGYIQSLAVAQQQDGAAVLDVNVGAPDVDEVDMLPRAVKAVQAVSSLPLQLDSANVRALEAALRVYNGRAIVNSTSGEEEKLAAVLPLCKKYGAAVVGLTLDEKGIPPTAEGRLAVAQKILNAALAAGLAKEDVCIDCLTLAASAEPGAGGETLRAVRLVKEKLGLKTVLGVSNVSFGLPNRPLLNQTFLAMALQEGLDLPILNPGDEGMRGALAAYRLLAGQPGATEAYVDAYSGGTLVAKPAQGEALPLGKAIERGLQDEAAAAATKLLSEGKPGLTLVNEYMMPALDRVGQGVEAGTIFLPQLLAAAGAAGAAFEKVKASFGTASVDGPPVVVATVKGDIHDIGKNIVKVLLENYGFTVVDLGRDVPPARVVEAAKASGAKLVGLSALMTTTLPAMADTIAALREAGLECKIVVGGAVLTEEYAMKIGADYYAKDAKKTVDVARALHGMA